MADRSNVNLAACKKEKGDSEVFMIARPCEFYVGLCTKYPPYW